MDSDNKYTAADLRNLIALKFDASPIHSNSDEWILATEVGNMTGYSRSRNLDVVLVNCYPSKGLTLHGMEIKVSVADLRHELENPQKHRVFYDNLDFFSLVCPPGVVKLDLLPAKWGVLVPTKDGSSLRALRKALPLHDETRPVIDRDFAVSLMRAFAVRGCGKEEMAQELGRMSWEEQQRQQKHWKEYYQKQNEVKAADLAAREDRLNERAKQFQEATGVSLFDTWNDSFERIIKAAAALTPKSLQYNMNCIDIAVDFLAEVQKSLSGITVEGWGGSDA